MFHTRVRAGVLLASLLASLLATSACAERAEPADSGGPTNHAAATASTTSVAPAPSGPDYSGTDACVVSAEHMSTLLGERVSTYTEQEGRHCLYFVGEVDWTDVEAVGQWWPSGLQVQFTSFEPGASSPAHEREGFDYMATTSQCDGYTPRPDLSADAWELNCPVPYVYESTIGPVPYPRYGLSFSAADGVTWVLALLIGPDRPAWSDDRVAALVGSLLPR